MTNLPSILICTLDENPIHREAFKFVSEKSEIARIQFCEHLPDDDCRSFPDLVMFNMEMKDSCSNFRLLKILEQFPEIPIICYSQGVNVSGYISNKYDTRLIYLPYDKVMQNLLDYMNNLTDYTANQIQQLGRNYEPSAQTLHGFDKLSSRELEVFSLLGKVHGVLEIIDVLGIKRSTIESHIKTLRHKLKLNSTQEIKYQALTYAKSTSCVAFSNSDDHICPHRQCSLGNCVLIRSA